MTKEIIIGIGEKIKSYIQGLNTNHEISSFKVDYDLHEDEEDGSCSPFIKIKVEYYNEFSFEDEDSFNSRTDEFYEGLCQLLKDDCSVDLVNCDGTDTSFFLMIYLGEL